LGGDAGYEGLGPGHGAFWRNICRSFYADAGVGMEAVLPGGNGLGVKEIF